VQQIRPFLYFVRKAKTGTTNLLMGCVCVLIPVIGGVLLLGYRTEVAEDLTRDPDLTEYPDFQFDKFGEYLRMGLWPFLTQLVVVLGFVLPYTLFCGGVGYAIHEFVVNHLLIAAAGGFLVWSLGMLMMQCLLWPMEYHAQVTRSFAPFRELRFALGFLRKVGVATVISILVFNFVSSWLSLLGMMLFCVGQYPAVVIQSMAEQHFIVQLYKLYLEEGGEPILERIGEEAPRSNEPDLEPEW
jgi:hypothetical protein